LFLISVTAAAVSAGLVVVKEKNSHYNPERCEN
jgi:hypothetical protein